MNKLMEQAIHTMIHKQFELWNEQDAVMNEFMRGLFHGCTNEDSRDEVYARMIINSMEIAAEISAKIVVEMLFTSGVFESVDERQLRKSLLSIVKEQNPEPGINEDK